LHQSTRLVETFRLMYDTPELVKVRKSRIIT
jgi:hypothetical protein